MVSASFALSLSVFQWLEPLSTPIHWFIVTQRSVKEFDSAGHTMTTRFLSVFPSWNCMGCPAKSVSITYFFPIKDSTLAENTDFQMMQVLRPNWQFLEICEIMYNCFVMLYWFSVRNWESIKLHWICSPSTSYRTLSLYNISTAFKKKVRGKVDRQSYNNINYYC